MPRILLEDVTATFVPDRTALTQALTEARTSGRSAYPLRLPGKFSLCDTVNGNNRIYPKRVWEKNLSEDSVLMLSIKSRDSLGLLEHPVDGKPINLLSPISHIVTRATMTEGGEVDGEITLVNTSEGQKLGALIEAGYIPKVSSRGYGSVVKRPDGIDEVQEDFICEAWDAVYNPSFKKAKLEVPQAEGAKALSQSPVIEASTTVYGDPATVHIAKAPAPTTLPAPQPVRAEPVTQSTSMDTKTLRESVQALRTIDVSKLDPRQLSEGFNRMQELHREAAQLVAKDANASWDVQRTHEELNAMEKSWQEALQAPATNVSKLQEQQTRTFKVLREAAAVGLKYRTKLAESLKTVARKTEIVTELARRGNAWRNRAQRLESSMRATTSKLDMAYECLDEFARRYHEDTTALARHSLMLEHKGKIEADAALLKRVNEAKRVDQLTAINEELKKPAAGKVTAPAAAAPAPAKPVAESTTPAAAPASAPVRVESNIRSHSVNETVSMTLRLSQASAALNG